MAATTVTFNPGDVVGVPAVVVATLDDDPAATPPGVPEGEPTETFHVVLENEAGADLGTEDPATCEILDDEAKVSVADVTADEGGDVTFTVSLNPAPQADVVVGYAFHNDALAATTATAGAACTAGVDYLLPSGVDLGDVSVDLTVRAGSGSAAIPAVTTCDDSIAEPDERFWLELSVVSRSEAVIEPDDPDDGGWATIEDNDTLAISVDDTAAAEGETLEFEVGLEVGGNPTALVAPVTLDYAIEEASPSVSAVEGSDYTAALGHSLTGQLTFQNDACSINPETHTNPTDCTSNSGDWIAGKQTLQVDLLADYEVEGRRDVPAQAQRRPPAAPTGCRSPMPKRPAPSKTTPRLKSRCGRLTGPEGSTQSFTVSSGEIPAAATP